MPSDTLALRDWARLAAIEAVLAALVENLPAHKRKDFRTAVLNAGIPTGEPAGHAPTAVAEAYRRAVNGLTPIEPRPRRTPPPVPRG